MIPDEVLIVLPVLLAFIVTFTVWGIVYLLNYYEWALWLNKQRARAKDYLDKMR